MSDTSTPSADHTSAGSSFPGANQQAAPRRTAAVVLVVVAVTVALAVMLAAAAASVLRHSDTRTQALDTRIQRLDVVVDGRVTVEAGERTAVTLTRHWGLFGAPDTSVTSTGGTVRVRGDCRALSPGCSTDLAATVAPDTEIVVVTSAGAVSVTGTTAGVDLRTSAGAVDVKGVSGPVRLRTSAGAIEGTVVNGDVDAQTSAGRIALTVSGSVERLSAVTSAGSVDLTVPDEVYRVDAETSAGSTDIQVRTDPASSRLIIAHTSAGSISIHRTG
jgi:hypothetical protein